MGRTLSRPCPLTSLTDLQREKRGIEAATSARPVSIVIATLNAGSVLRRCLQSISQQDHPGSEVIVIDGGSRDATVGIVLKNADRIAHWESEPDRGIYHAWNKGLEVASGEWVCFIGADDYFPARNRLSMLVAAAVREDADIVSGRAVVVDSAGRALRVVGEPWSWGRLKRHQYVIHPAMLHRRTLFDSYGCFDETYKIAGDYAFLLRIGPNVRTAFVDEVVIHISDRGASRGRLLPLLKETWRAQARHPDIGPARATLNFADSALKAQTRRLMGQPT